MIISVSRFQTYQQPTEERIPLAGMFFVIAALFMVASMVLWAVARHRIPSGLFAVQAVMTLLLGVATSLAIGVWGLRDSVESWHTWVIPVNVAVVLSVLFLSVLIIFRSPPEPISRKAAAELR